MDKELVVLKYIIDSDFSVTYKDIVEEFEPYGREVWLRLYKQDFVFINKYGYINITKSGLKSLG